MNTSQSHTQPDLSSLARGAEARASQTDSSPQPPLCIYINPLPNLRSKKDNLETLVSKSDNLGLTSTQTATLLPILDNRASTGLKTGLNGLLNESNR